MIYTWSSFSNIKTKDPTEQLSGKQPESFVTHKNIIILIMPSVTCITGLLSSVLKLILVQSSLVTKNWPVKFAMPWGAGKIID